MISLTTCRLIRKRKTRYHFNIIMGGPQRGSGSCWEKKNFVTCRYRLSVLHGRKLKKRQNWTILWEKNVKFQGNKNQSFLSENPWKKFCPFLNLNINFPEIPFNVLLPYNGKTCLNMKTSVAALSPVCFVQQHSISTAARQEMMTK